MAVQSLASFRLVSLVSAAIISYLNPSFVIGGTLYKTGERKTEASRNLDLYVSDETVELEVRRNNGIWNSVWTSQTLEGDSWRVIGKPFFGDGSEAFIQDDLLHEQAFYRVEERRAPLSIWLAVGQSNMVSTSKDGTFLSDASRDDEVLFWSYAGSYDAQEPRDSQSGMTQVSAGWQTFATYGIDEGAGYGPERGFARDFLVNRADKSARLGILKVAFNGSSLDSFYENEGNSTEKAKWAALRAEVDAALAEANSLGYDPTVEGLLFVQGTSDARTELGDTYLGRFRTLVSQYRARWNPSMKVVVLNHPAFDLYDDPTGGAPVVRSAFQEFADSDDLGFIANTQGAESVGDDVHYTNKWDDINGVRLSRAVIHGLSELPTEPLPQVDIVADEMNPEAGEPGDVVELSFDVIDGSGWTVALSDSNLNQDLSNIEAISALDEDGSFSFELSANEAFESIRFRKTGAGTALSIRNLQFRYTPFEVAN